MAFQQVVAKQQNKMIQFLEKGITCEMELSPKIIFYSYIFSKYLALELVTNVKMNRLLFKIYIDFCSSHSKPKSSHNGEHELKKLPIRNSWFYFIFYTKPCSEIYTFHFDSFIFLITAIELTKVGSVKSGKLFVVNDTIIQAIQRTAIKMTIRYGRRTKTL